MKKQLVALAIGVLCVSPNCVFGEDRIWTGAVDNNFMTPGNWDSGAPTTDEDLVVIDGGANLPVIIPVDAGELSIGGFQLGTSGEAGGHIIQNGGTLIVAPLSQDGLPTSYEFKSHIGDQGTLPSSYIMNNDAVMIYDGAEDGDGFGFGGNGENEFDLEVGARLGDVVGRFEMHDNSILRLSDDLKIGAEENGNGYVLLDGNAMASMGSGLSVSEGPTSKGVLEVRGNALMVTGNSAGAGESEKGFTDEGYLTLSVRPDTSADVTVADSGKLYARTLQQRDGVSNLTLQDSGEFHVFDVFNFESPDLGTATVVGSTSNPTSHVASQPTSEITILIQDNAKMSVDSDLDAAAWSGLALSGGTNGGGNTPGGKSLLEIRDSGSFSIQQDLHLALGNEESADSTLKVVGPDATVLVNGNLYMALDPDGIETLGSATLQTTLTANSHSTVQVGGEAVIGNGILSVELDGFSPRGGEVFTLLEANEIVGDEFLETDFSMAELPEGLDWELSIDNKAITLSIAGMLEGLLGDFDANGSLELSDLNALVLQIGGDDLGFDVDNDQSLTSLDITAWLTAKSDADGVAYVSGDSNLDGQVNFADFLLLSASFGTADTNWGQGNYDGVDGTAFADFLALSENFGTGAAGSQSVPEPSAAHLAFLGLLGVLSLRIRRS